MENYPTGMGRSSETVRNRNQVVAIFNIKLRWTVICSSEFFVELFCQVDVCSKNIGVILPLIDIS